MAMFCRKRWRGLFCMALVSLVGALGTSVAEDGWVSGVGYSDAFTVTTAVATAASQAKEGLGGVEPKFVMVTAAEPMVGEELLTELRKHFPEEIIYGCEVTSPLTPNRRVNEIEQVDVDVGVAVWALGGGVDIDVKTMATHAGDVTDSNAYYTCGKELAGQLRGFLEKSTRPGTLVVTWGDQYTGSNKEYVRGLNDGFGEALPIIGGASGSGDAKIIVKGRIVTGINVGLAITGDFTVGMALMAGRHTPATTEQVLRNAGKYGEGEKPVFGFVFNCRRRRYSLVSEGTLAEEHTIIRRHFPGGFFGFYGPGEVGATEVGKPSEGVGFTVVAAMVFPTK